GLCANASKIRGIEIESALVKKIEQDLFSDSFLNGLIDEIINLKQKEIEQADAPALERRRQDLSAKILNLTRLAAVAVDVAEIGQQLAELSRERNAVDALLLAADKRSATIDRKAISAKVAVRLGRTLELLKSPADVDQLRLELKKWIA